MDTYVQNLIVYNTSRARNRTIDDRIHSAHVLLTEFVTPSHEANRSHDNYNAMGIETVGFPPGNGSPPFFGPPPLHPAMEAIKEHVKPITLTLGFSGNILLLLVFLATPLKKCALAHYLAAVGVADLAYVACCLGVWEDKTRITGVCQVVMFGLHLSKFLDTWYLALAHVERLLTHFYISKTIPSSLDMRRRDPERGLYSSNGGGGGGGCGSSTSSSAAAARRWCSVFRTKCVIITVFIFSMVGFMHFMWSHLVYEGICMFMIESYHVFGYLHRAEMIASHYFPFLVIVLVDSALLVMMVVRMATRLVAWRRKRSSFLSSSTTFSSKSPTSQKSRLSLCGNGGSDWKGEYTLASTGNGEKNGKAKEEGGAKKGRGGSWKHSGNGHRSSYDSGSRSSGSRSGSGKDPPPELDLNRDNLQATAAVVLIGLFFIVLVLPHSITDLREDISQMRKSSLMSFLEEMFKIKAAVNFIVYFVLIGSFRRGLLRLLGCLALKCFCCRRKEGESQDLPLQETSV